MDTYSVVIFPYKTLSSSYCKEFRISTLNLFSDVLENDFVFFEKLFLFKKKKKVIVITVIRIWFRASGSLE